MASAAEASIQAWEVVPGLARLAGLRADLLQARTEAAAAERDLAPLRAEHAGHASRLRHRLAALARAADEKAETADAAVRAVAQEAENQKASADRAREEEREASSAATAARTRLEVLDSGRRRGVELGHSPTLTTPPADHRDIVARSPGRACWRARGDRGGDGATESGAGLPSEPGSAARLGVERC